MSTSTLTRLLAVTTLTGALIAAGAAGASAAATTPATATPTGHYAGPGQGYDGVIDGHAAGATLLALASTGSTVDTYCLQYSKPGTSDPKVTFAATSWADSKITGLPKVADIVSRHASIGTPLSTPQAEKAAVQLAVWNLTDKVDYTQVPNAEIVARTAQLLTGATSASEGPSKLNLVVESAVSNPDAAGKTTVTFQVVVTDQARHPVSGVQVVVAEPDGTTTAARTNAEGLATGMAVPSPAQASTATVTVSGTVAAGSVFAPADGGQEVITASDTTATTTASPTIPVPAQVVAPAPTTPPAAPVAAAPAPAAPAPAAPAPAAPAAVVAATGDAPRVLPHTGPVAGIGAFLALLAVAGVGAAGVVKARRRA